MRRAIEDEVAGLLVTDALEKFAVSDFGETSLIISPVRPKKSLMLGKLLGS